MNYPLTDMRRRLENLIRIGTIDEVNYKKAEARVLFQENENDENMASDFLPFLTSRAHENITWDPPEKGEVVMVFSRDGDPENGVILGSLYQNKYPSPESSHDKTVKKWKDGASISYDRSSSTLNIDIPKNIMIKCKNFQVETEKAEIKNSTVELIEALRQALQIEAQSKTPTLMGPQLSLEESIKLPIIKKKLETFK